MRNSPTSIPKWPLLWPNRPVISVDTKKKELVGDFRNNGREYRPQGNPEEVRVHGFLIKKLGRAAPYVMASLWRPYGVPMASMILRRMPDG